MRRPRPYTDAGDMPRPSDPQGPTRNYAPVSDETTLTSLTVEGNLPTALTGRYVRIGPNAVAPSTTSPGRTLDGMVHAVELHAGRAVRYRSRWVTTDNVARTLGTDPIPGPPAAALDTVAKNVITFGGRTFALGPGALAYELDDQLATLSRVDLAGHGRGIGAHPQIDPLTGALHLVSYGDEAAHHIVSPNSHTRITVPVPDVPGPLQDVLLTGERFVLIGEGFVGMTERTGQPTPRWSDADLDGAIAAGDLGLDVAVVTATSSLVRWTLNGAGARCEVVDATPQRFGTTNPYRVSAPTYVWTVSAIGGTEVYRHNLRTGDRTSHDLGPGRHAGELTFVPDPTRLHREDGGWLVGFIHDDQRSAADLVVLDAAAMENPPIAMVRIPRRIPYGLHGTWIPST
jgi:8'-apo-carotenoid 13,14-cleaving dioxygenase